MYTEWYVSGCGPFYVTRDGLGGRSGQTLRASNFNQRRFGTYAGAQKVASKYNREGLEE